MPKTTEEQHTKSGFKTTEFWLTIAGNIAAILLTVGETVSPEIGGIMIVVGNSLYALSRGISKKHD